MKPENGMLVRINLDDRGVWDAPLTNLLDRRVLVPVEPCEHGHYDPHRLPTGCAKPGCLVLHPVIDCPGAGIGGNE